MCGSADRRWRCLKVCIGSNKKAASKNLPKRLPGLLSPRLGVVIGTALRLYALLTYFSTTEPLPAK